MQECLIDTPVEIDLLIVAIRRVLIVSQVISGLIQATTLIGWKGLDSYTLEVPILKSANLNCDKRTLSIEIADTLGLTPRLQARIAWGH